MMEIYSDHVIDKENDCSAVKQPDVSRSTSYCARTPLLDVKNRTAQFSTGPFGSSREPKSALSRLDALNLQTSETPKRQKRSSGLRRSCFAAFHPQQDVEEGVRKLTITLPRMDEEELPDSNPQSRKIGARETKTPPNSPTVQDNPVDKGLSTITEASFTFETFSKTQHEISQNAETCSSSEDVNCVSLYESDQIDVGNEVTVSYNSVTVDGVESSCEDYSLIFKQDSKDASVRDSHDCEDVAPDSDKGTSPERNLDKNQVRSSLIAIVEAETDSFVDMLLEECASDLALHQNPSFQPLQDHFAKDHPYMKATIEDQPVHLLKDNVGKSLSSPALSSAKTALFPNSFHEHMVQNSTPKSTSRNRIPFQNIQTPTLESPLNDLVNISSSSFRAGLQNADLSELMETYLLSNSSQSSEEEKESLSSSSIKKLLEIDPSPNSTCSEEVGGNTSNDHVTLFTARPRSINEPVQDHGCEKKTLENSLQEFLFPKYVEEVGYNNSNSNVFTPSATAANVSARSNTLEKSLFHNSREEALETQKTSSEQVHCTLSRNSENGIIVNESNLNQFGVIESVKNLSEEMESTNPSDKNTSIPSSPEPQLDRCRQLHSSVDEISLSPVKKQELSKLISDIDAQINVINYNSVFFTPNKAIKSEVMSVTVGTSPHQIHDVDADSVKDVSVTDNFPLVTGRGDGKPGKEVVTSVFQDEPQITGLNRSMITEKSETVSISTNASLSVNNPIELKEGSGSLLSDQHHVVGLDKSVSTDKPETVSMSTNTSFHDHSNVSVETASIAINTSLREIAEVSVLTEQCQQVLVDRSMITDVDVLLGDTHSVADSAVTLDHSMMAVPDALNKQTMTDRKSLVDAESSMTPFKLNNKQGRRLTAEEIRRQHPRAVANHLETLMSTNQRLEKEVKTASHERDRLKSVVKDTKSRLTGTEKELEEVKQSQEKHIAMLEQLHDEATIGLQSCIEEKQNRIYSLEEEVKETKAKCQLAEETLSLKESEWLTKCEHLEKVQQEAKLHFEEQVKSLMSQFEKNNYKHQFEASQIIIQELQMEKAEFAGLMDDIEKTAALQSRLKEALDKMASKTQKSVKDHAVAYSELVMKHESLRNHCTALEIDLEIAMAENKELEEEISRVCDVSQLKAESFTEMNAQLSTVSQELLKSKAEVSRLSEDLTAAQQDVSSLTETKQLLINQLLEQQDSETLACQALQEANEKIDSLKQQLEEESQSFTSYQKSHEKMKTDWEDMRTKMELYIQNLQHTLDSWEVDRDLQDQEVYECHQQLADRQAKIDTMTKELSALRKIQATTQTEKNLMTELKNTNQFLEAEKDLYLNAITDFRTRLEAETELRESKEHLIEALKSSNHELQERYKCDLQMLEEDLLAKTTELETSWTALENLEENMESVLSTLQQKFGIEIKCDSSKKNTSRTKYTTPQKTPSAFNKGYSLVAQVLSKADNQLNHSQTPKSASFLHQDTEDSSSLSSSSVKALKKSSVKDDSLTNGGVFHPKQSNVEYGASQKHLGAAAAALLSPHSHSFSVPSQRAKMVECQAKSVSFCHPAEGLRSAHDGSPKVNLGNNIVPGFAKIRSIPSTVERSSQKLTTGDSNTPKVKSSSLLSTSSSLASSLSEQDTLSAKVKNIDRLFTQILKTADIAERQSELTIKDLKGNIEILNDKLRFQVRQTNDIDSELEKKTEMLINANSQIKELNARVSGMTQSLLNFQDQSIEIRRLEESKGEMKHKIHDLEGKCKLLTEQLEDVILKLDSTEKGQKPDVACLRENVALKEKKHELLMKLCEEKNKHKELGDKAVKRLIIFEDNWRKAEAEVQRFDDLVESIRQTCIKHQSQSTHPALLKIVRLIDGQS